MKQGTPVNKKCIKCGKEFTTKRIKWDLCRQCSIKEVLKLIFRNIG